MAGETDRATGPNANNGVGAVGSKTEAVRRALEELGPDAKPLAIQEHVKDRYGVEITTKVISVYKGKLGKRGRKRGRPGRKPKAEVVAAAAPRVAGHVAGHAEVTIKDLRAIKELSDRVGAGRLRELLELLA
jgi:hypothetical protein